MSGHTHIHTYTHDNYYNPRCAHAHRGLINSHKQNGALFGIQQQVCMTVRWPSQNEGA